MHTGCTSRWLVCYNGKVSSPTEEYVNLFTIEKLGSINLIWKCKELNFYVCTIKRAV